MFNRLGEKFGILDRKTVICPKCLNQVQVSTTREHQTCEAKVEDQFGELSQACGYEFPIRYIKEYIDVPPVPVQVFGWSNHGKTVYLDVLRLMLMNMRKVWPDYIYTSITDDDLAKERQLRNEVTIGVMPGSTKPKDRTQNIVYIMQMQNMIRYNSRFMAIMDHAGERFDTMRDFEAHEIPFLTHPDTTTLMFVSVPLLLGNLVGKGAIDAKQKEREAGIVDVRPAVNMNADENDDLGRSMDQLLSIYIEAMIKFDTRQDSKRGVLQRVRERVIRHQRKLVVVLTMADRMIHKLPPNIQRYLAKDTLWDQIFVRESRDMDNDDMEAYLDEMQKISDSIHDWLLDDTSIPGGQNLVAKIDSSNINARYCVVSAIGHDEVSELHTLENADKRTGTKIAPKRVIDPFFWILEYQKR